MRFHAELSVSISSRDVVSANGASITSGIFIKCLVGRPLYKAYSEIGLFFGGIKQVMVCSGEISLAPPLRSSRAVWSVTVNGWTNRLNT